MRTTTLTLLLSVVAAQAGAAQFGPFDWLKNTFERIEGLNGFVGFGRLWSDELEQSDLREFGFELVFGLTGSTSSSATPSTATCEVTGAGSCKAEVPAPSIPPKNRAVVQPSTLTLIKGKDGRLRATFYDENGDLVTGTPGDFDFSSPAPAVAMVDATGRVTAVGEGVVTLTVQRKNPPADSKPAKVIVTVGPEVKPSWSFSLYVGLNVITGVRAAEPTLDLRMAVRDFPSVTLYASPPHAGWGAIGKVFPIYFGGTVGITELWHARAVAVGASPQVFQAKANAVMLGAAAGLAWPSGAKDFYVFTEAAFRARIFGSVRWFVGDQETAPPAGWPKSLTARTLMFRFGVGGFKF